MFVSAPHSHPPPRKRLHRFEHTNHARFLTFSCYRRLPLLNHPAIRDLFALRLTISRERSGFHLYAWVAMPEHAHLLLWPKLPGAPVDAVLHQIKTPLAREVSGAGVN